MSKPAFLKTGTYRIPIADAVTVIYDDAREQALVIPDLPDVPVGKVVNVPPGSIDTIDFNATADTRYLFARNAKYTGSKPRWIKKSGITLAVPDGAGELPMIDYTGADRSALFEVRGDNFTARNLICSGKAGTIFIKARGCKNFTADTIHQALNPANLKGQDFPYEFNGKHAVAKAAKGGITPIDIGGMTDARITGIVTIRTTRYGIYVSATMDDGSIKRNSGLRIENCNLGPSDTEHCLRCYHIDYAVIEDLVTDNRGSQFKQSVKLMSGSGVVVRRWTDKGDSRRLGRDVNDKPPENFTLGVTIEDSTFAHSTWFRIDPGCTATLRRCRVDAVDKGSVFDIDDNGMLMLDQVACTHTNAIAKLSDNDNRVKRLGPVTLNGAAA